MASGGSLEGRVALVTGAARGIGRASAVRLAREGADVVLLDLCRDLAASPYRLAVDEDLSETARLVEAAGGRALARRADVREQGELDAAVADALQTFGRLDVVVPNAGVASFGRAWELTEEQWRTVIDVVLTGVWHTLKAVVPTLIEAGRGGSIVIVGSAVGTRPAQNHAHYVAAKHGVVGLARAFALEVAEHSIRVNVVAPGSVRTELAGSDAIAKLMRPDLEAPRISDASEIMRANHALPVQWAEPDDVAAAVAWLAGEQSRYVTGAVLPVDAGWVIN
ncbi:mycofactocin-coupled SDR family oxidoreductase [Conexibacter sp. CPCC 206217]|uniref:mycofactocin-coupled SDR family oxidoreductase n=1 Tax=Conexibacter sp. CPCC 206217 TaxID=3064574 RepID=UPI00271F1ADE|nr:mycofactocin-coupled SDR family oxidoreductase [Conexibacter sp. CPCC 206217]MDO8212570.1 mycofactocin-coupled SDR family oxidoreductase [Conexibacter sp. CPCC 206217]